jgi:PAS domain-containing protein
VNKPKQFYDLLDNFTTGVIIHGADTEILFSNQAALKLLGLTIDQIKGKSATDPRWCFIREDGSKMPLEEFPVNLVLSSKKATVEPSESQV